MSRTPTTILAAALALFAAAPAAGAATGVSPGAPAHGFAPGEVVVKREGQARGHAVRLPWGVGVREATTALRKDPDVAYAAPNFLATAAATGVGPGAAVGGAASAAARGFLPGTGIANDPGPIFDLASSAGGWVSLQWNMLPWRGEGTAELPTSPGGIDAVGAWRNLIKARRRGAVGTTVAVLDTGVAYRSWGARFRRSPDFSANQFVPGYDFVDDDRLPLDENGHGTHVAGTIAEKTHNRIGLVGLAYRAKLMPIRVLDRNGSGQADDIARAIRWAVDRGADVINMSFNFGCGKRVPGIYEELRRAYRRGVVTVASIGNLGSEACISPPATAPRTIGVGGTTEGGCLGSYSLTGTGVDVVAPGGGPPIPGCDSIADRPIYQVTLRGGNPRRFGEPGTYIGTSMAAAHVSGVAAMVLASGVVRRGVSPRGKVNRVTRRLRRTARGIGLPHTQQGAGLIDAAAATARGSS